VLCCKQPGEVFAQMAVADEQQAQGFLFHEPR
jgi:hypothetical protein